MGHAQETAERADVDPGGSGVAPGRPGVDPDGSAAAEPDAGRPPAPEELSADVRRTAREQLEEDFDPRTYRFLMDLSSALRKYAFHPPGHRSLEPHLQNVVRALRPLLGEAGRVTVTVGPDHLMVGRARTDADNPLLRAVAGRLHDHHLLAVTFREGIQPEELSALLETLATEILDEEQDPLGLRGPEALDRWPHVDLQALDYDPLRLAEWDEEEPLETYLLRNVHFPFETEVAGVDVTEEGPEAVAAAIERRLRAESGARAVAVEVFRLTRELTTAAGQAGRALRGRFSEVVTKLSPRAVDRLLEIGAEGGRRSDFVRDAAEWMDPDAVLHLLEPAVDGRDGGIGGWMLRLMSKLGSHAGTDGSPYGSEPDAAMRQLAHRLVDDWELEDPRPESYSSALQQITDQPPDAVDAVRADVTVESSRVLMMGVEIGDASVPVLGSMRKILDAGGAGDLLSVMEEAPEDNEVAGRLWDRLSTPEAVHQLLHEEPPAFGVLDRVIEELGAKVADPMLEVFTESSSRSVRRELFDRLADLGPGIVPRIAARLEEDDRWYVERNMLSLMAETGAVPEDLDLGPYLEHDERRVRAEAFRLALEHGADRERALTRALRDDDRRLVTLGLAAAEERCPPAAESFVIRALRNEELPDEARASAARALADRGSPQGMKALVELVVRRRWILPDRLEEPTPVVRAALEALARAWPEAEPAREVLRMAREAGDPALAEAAAPPEDAATDADAGSGQREAAA